MQVDEEEKTRIDYFNSFKVAKIIAIILFFMQLGSSIAFSVSSISGAIRIITFLWLLLPLQTLLIVYSFRCMEIAIENNRELEMAEEKDEE
jgi:uncharacterized Tic20 family protein